MLKNENRLPDIAGPDDFHRAAIGLFRFQYDHNPVYRAWVELLGVNKEQVQQLHEIPFLPVSFFKSHDVVIGAPDDPPQIVFSSSGTTGSSPARHIVNDLLLYEESFTRGFRHFYGDPAEYCILALLPGYLERSGSSLVYMMEKLIGLSGHKQSGFYLRDHGKLIETLARLKDERQKALLIGVSYALLDLSEHDLHLGDDVIVMETGGMKGTRREMLRPELHEILKKKLGVNAVHSEYGMTELLSQAYSKGDGLFASPPWLRFFIRSTDDPLQITDGRRTGGVNVIDLANVNSCAFLATQDLGRLHSDNRLELMGRFDHSDIRGCNLMMQGM